MQLGNSIPDTPENQWRFQLDRFVRDNQPLLAALAWGLQREWGDTPDVLGIDLRPTPHFVCCGRESLELLNHQVDGQIQEILGVLDGYDPSLEVAIVGIGLGQIKLIHYQPELSPPDCFARHGQDLDELIDLLEKQMQDRIVALS